MDWARETYVTLGAISILVGGTIVLGLMLSGVLYVIFSLIKRMR